MKGSLLAAAIAVLLAGCQTARPLYYWGHYESLIYQDYAKPGKMTPEAEAKLLEEDLQKAAAANLPAHPGLHAHLGYLYIQMGRVDQARQEFAQEKALFPESAPFMDRMLARLTPK